MHRGVRRVRLEAYKTGLKSGEYDGKTQEDIAKLLGVTSKTIRQWARKYVDWTEVRDARRDRIAKDIVDIDAAMVRKAKAGDARAADLVYRRIEGWIPSAEQIQTGKNPTISDADLNAMTEALKQLARSTEEARKDAAAVEQITALGVVGEGGSREAETPSA